MKKSLNVIGIILSIFVVIALFFIQILLGVKLPTTRTMEVENLSVIMEEIDIERIFRDENGKEKPMGTRIYHYFDDIGLGREDVDKVVKDKSFKKIIGSYLGTMFMHGIDGTEVIYPTKPELVNFIHKNYNSFQHVTDFPEDYDQEEIERIVSENYSNVKYELDELSKDIKFDEFKEIETVQKILSTKTILLVGGIILCIVLLIVFRHSFYKWLKWVSYPTIISGVIFILAGIIVDKVIASRLNYGQYQFILELIVKNIAKNVAIYGALSLAIGIIFIIIHSVIKKNVKPKKILVDEPEFEEEKEVEEETKEETE